MATTANVCLVVILLQLTFILGTESKSLETSPADPNDGTIIKAFPGGTAIVLGKGVTKIKGFLKHAGKYYDENTGDELTTDPFHSVDSGKFFVTDCGNRVFQLEGNVKEVTATPAATESTPTPAPEERTLQEKDGQYVDTATGTTTKSPFSRLSWARVTATHKGNFMRIEFTSPVDNPPCPTQEQMNAYFQKISMRLTKKE